MPARGRWRAGDRGRAGSGGRGPAGSGLPGPGTASSPAGWLGRGGRDPCRGLAAGGSPHPSDLQPVPRLRARLEPVPSSVPPPGIHPTAVVAADARVAPSASVGPLTVVGSGAEVGTDTILEAQVAVGAGVRIGRGCRIFPQVTLRDGVVLGDRVTVHSGAVIGADGFGYARDGHRYVKIPQIGRVVIEDEVEIGANVTIDRATLGETRIGRGTKIDNLVQIGHNVRVGADTVIVAQVGISGSTRIGSRVTLAGQVGVVDHVDIGDDVIVGAQAGVTKDIPAGSVVLGSPAIPHGEFKRQLAVAARLPEMRKILRALEERLAALEARLTR
ncbi:MAG: UDP-3-O-(3-hydroxymyristoyl)glucosamine N-acyltransferase [candidate division NC10 bacterium]|nr:UDP-3-O-(3-hydroxymyristoyl)glucosamine N-acyltransferase [candidate division NC10 bacterium]